MAEHSDGFTESLLMLQAWHQPLWSMKVCFYFRYGVSSHTRLQNKIVFPLLHNENFGFLALHWKLAVCLECRCCPVSK